MEIITSLLNKGLHLILFIALIIDILFVTRLIILLNQKTPTKLEVTKNEKWLLILATAYILSCIFGGLNYDRSLF